MAEEGAMDSLLAAVEVEAAKTKEKTAPSTSASKSKTATNMRLSARNVPPYDYTSAAPPISQKSYVSLPEAPPLPAIRVPPSPPNAMGGKPLQLPPPPPLPPPLPSPPPIPATLPLSAPAAPRLINPAYTPHGGATPASAPAQSRMRSTPSSSTECPKKGARIFSASDKTILEANYAKNKFPTRIQMITLARALGKSTDKVRTWYNNRRAFDRKLGLDVERNTPDTPRLAASASAVRDIDASVDRVTVTSQRHDAESNDVILPANLASSPLEGLVATPQSAARVEPAWRLGTSPVTGAADTSPTPITPMSPPSTITASVSRVRIAPLRIRQVRLVIGDATVYGDVPHDPPLDQGLEVKFLFGKKRIVYEWYIGNDYTQSQETGGPYAKMEMGFSSITRFSIIQGPSTTVMRIRLAYDPALFLQTEESMNKFKQRAQQRQYRRAAKDQFPISVAGMPHAITMQTDEAVRVCNILLEDYPRLMDVFEASLDDKFVGARTSPTRALRLRELGPLLTRERLTRAAEFAVTSKGKTGSATKLASLDLSRTGEPVVWQSPSRVEESSSVPARSREDGGTVSTTSRGVRRNACDGGSEMQVTPITRRTGEDERCERVPTTVRRELNFDPFHGSSPQRRQAGSKRRSVELGSTDADENSRRSRVRRRLSDEEDDTHTDATTRRDNDTIINAARATEASASAEETAPPGGTTGSASRPLVSTSSGRGLPSNTTINNNINNSNNSYSYSNNLNNHANGNTSDEEQRSDTSKAETAREQKYGVIRLLPR